MSHLTVYPDDQPECGESFSTQAAIQDQLQQIGVQFERWQAAFEFDDQADQSTVLQAYQSSIDELRQKHSFKTVDVISMQPNHPEKQMLRQKFLDEHIHEDFEVRFFVEGSGLFYLHAASKVFAVLCEQGDLISVPAITTHWFDMGENPRFKCIRLFTTEEGWVAKFTGSKIAQTFPTYDQYLVAIA